MLHPTLETPRLSLRGFTNDDFDLLYALYGDPQVMQFLGDGTPLSREAVQEKLAAVLYRWTQIRIPLWAMFRKEDGVFVGRCGFSPYDPFRVIELAYTVIPSAWNRGYCTEASHACLRHAFEELQWERIMTRTRPDNLRSRRVMEKLGFEYEREGTDIGGPAVFYWLTRERYERGREGSRT